MTAPDQRIETLRTDRIPTSDDLADVDREALLDFSDGLYLRKPDYSDYRHEKLLRHCVRIAEHAGSLADALDDRDQAETIVRWINREYDNEETNRDYRVALRVFGKHMTDGDDPPESLAWSPGRRVGTTTRNPTHARCCTRTSTSSR